MCGMCGMCRVSEAELVGRIGKKVSEFLLIQCFLFRLPFSHGHFESVAILCRALLLTEEHFCSGDILIFFIRLQPTAVHIIWFFPFDYACISIL